MRSDYNERVIGRIVGKDGAPIGGAAVRVYDRDMVYSDHLGDATTDDDGRFSVGFKSSDFQDKFGFPEGRPDIFVEVQTASGSKTRSKVYEDLTGRLAEDDSIETMDLGEIAVES